MTTVTVPRSSPPQPESPAAHGSPRTALRSVGRWAASIGGFLAYGLVALVLGAVGFSLVLGLLAAGISTVVVWIGLPLLVVGVLVAHGFAQAERGVQRALLGTSLPTPAPTRPPAGAGRIRRMLTPLTDPQRWLDSLWVLVNVTLVLVTFPLALAWTVAAVGTIGGPLATLILETVLPPGETSGLSALLGVPDPYALPVDMALQCFVGLLFLLTLGPVIRGLTLLHQGVARGLLSSRYQEQQRLARAEQSRAAGRSAESAALRRLERDLHDGPQQRLVRASMDLARVESLAERDPAAARTVLRETREQLGLTLDDLRRLSRGIAPPILVDRGLAAALTELAAISPLPATVECPEMSLPEYVEIGIYYVVSEALTNAAKHSGAGSVRVEVARSGDDARVRITDDGRGGAEMRTGGGLAGLAGRIASLEGRLTVASPSGMGTRIEAVIPCAS